MNVEEFRDYCLSKKAVTESFPFNETTLVFKVMGKIFAITDLDAEEFKVNLKCDPDRAIELREQYPGQIIPGWHMNKQHWNTVFFENGLDKKLLIELIDQSYDLIVSKLPKKDKEAFESI